MEIQEPKPAAVIPEAEKKPEDNFRFPPVTNQTICLQVPGTGDVWMGFNPSRFYPRVVLAWAAFQIENAYANFEDRVRAARAQANQPKKKKSMREILLGK